MSTRFQGSDPDDLDASASPRYRFSVITRSFGSPSPASGREPMNCGLIHQACSPVPMRTTTITAVHGRADSRPGNTSLPSTMAKAPT